MRRSLLAAALALLLPGCAGTPVEIPEPLNASGRAASSAHYGSLHLGLYPSPAAQAAFGTLRSMQSFMNDPASERYRELDPQRIQDDLRAALSARFQEVRIVDNPDAAQTEGLDLVLEFGLKIDLPRFAPGETHLEMSGVFTDTRRRMIDTSATYGVGHIGVMGGTFALRPAWRAALHDFLTRVDDSTALQAYARAPKPRPSPSGVAAAPAPAPDQPAAPASDVDAPSYRMPEKADRFALIIGVEGYSTLPPAQFAERDAAAMKVHALAMGVPARNLIYLAGSKATRSAITKYVEEWLPRVVPAGGKVLFYYSGHGAPDPETGRGYLVPWDGDPAFLASTAYPIDELKRRLDALKAAEVLVITDACFSGAGGRSVLVAGARPLVSKVNASFAGTQRVAAFSAASSSEITATLPEQGHGLFTYYFLKGLNGAAADAAGHVNAGSLMRYLVPRVQDEARRQNREQSPGLALPASSVSERIVLR